MFLYICAVSSFLFQVQYRGYTLGKCEPGGGGCVGTCDESESEAGNNPGQNTCLAYFVSRHYIQTMACVIVLPT